MIDNIINSTCMIINISYHISYHTKHSNRDQKKRAIQQMITGISYISTSYLLRNSISEQLVHAQNPKTCNSIFSFLLANVAKLAVTYNMRIGYYSTAY